LWGSEPLPPMVWRRGRVRLLTVVHVQDGFVEWRLAMAGWVLAMGDTAGGAPGRGAGAAALRIDRRCGGLRDRTAGARGNSRVRRSLLFPGVVTVWGRRRSLARSAARCPRAF